MRLENSFRFLPGIGETTEQKLWNQGVTHWDEFEDTISGARREKAVPVLQKARKNLDVGNAAYFSHAIPSRMHWRLYRNFADDACFFDIETTGLDANRNKVTTASFYRAGETKTLVRGKDLTAENLADELFKSKVLVTFNGKRFDVPFIEQNFDVTVDAPHIDLMYDCKRVGLSGGLKAIEKDLDIDRDLDEEIDGRDAVRLWKKYERTGDRTPLEKLVHYNQLDVENLEPLLKIVHDRLRDKVFEPHL